MAYVDKALMIKIFGETELIQLTDRTNAGVIGDEVLNQAITTAEAEADSYLGAAYELPLPSVPVSLPAFVADIARYQLYDAEPTEHVAKKYDRAVSWLKDVAKGTVSLGFKKTDSTPASVVAVVQTRDQVFTDDLLKRMPGPWNF